jgi:hypothetical protein
VICLVEPMAPKATEEGLSCIEFATCATVTVTPLDTMPPDVAVMLVVPLATAVTRPLPPTVATAVLELDHEIVAVPIAIPPPSLATAANCTCRPTAASVGALTGAVIRTEATVIGGVPPSLPPQPPEISNAAIVNAQTDLDVAGCIGKPRSWFRHDGL